MVFGLSQNAAGSQLSQSRPVRIAFVGDEPWLREVS